MYLIINGNRHTVSKRIVADTSVDYLTVTPEPEEISGVIRMFRDDDFLMSEDNADDYAYKKYSGTRLTISKTNAEPEPEIEPVTDEVTWEKLAAAYTEGVEKA